MTKRTKGALAMVLAGAVTFSVTNALLAEPIKRLAKEIALPISGDPKKADVISKAEKVMKEQTPTTNVKDGQVAFENKNKSVIAIQADKQNTEKLSKSTTKNSVSTNVASTTTIASKPSGTDTKSATTRPATTTNPATSVKAPTTIPATTTNPATSVKAPTTRPATTTKPTTSVKAPTTTTPNRGQQVSEEAKENAASQREQKENNGKKM